MCRYVSLCVIMCHYVSLCVIMCHYVHFRHSQKSLGLVPVVPLIPPGLSIDTDIVSYLSKRTSLEGNLFPVDYINK